MRLHHGIIVIIIIIMRIHPAHLEDCNKEEDLRCSIYIQPNDKEHVCREHVDDRASAVQAPM